MKRKLVITFEFDDAPFFAEDEGTWYEDDALAHGMDIANSIASSFRSEFVKAELDKNLLITRDGDAPAAVKVLPQYDRFMNYFS